jgi:Holliday junction resolvase RusA-like endonuclease
VVLKLELVPPDRRPRDASNYVKPVEDALVEAHVLIDDSQNYVKAVVPYWGEPQRTSGVVVTIRPAREPQKPAPAQGELFTAT